MAITYSTVGNYHSVPDSPGLTIPNSDWLWLTIVRPTNVTPGQDLISTGQYGIANTFNIYVFGGDFGLKVNGLSDANVTSAVNNQWTLVACERSGTSANIRTIPMGGSTVTTGGVETVNEASNSTTGLFVGRRGDTGANPFQGAVSDAIFIPGGSISNAEMIALANGTAMDTQGWWASREIHIIPSVAASESDNTGNHTVSKTGTPPFIADSLDLVRFSSTPILINTSISSMSITGDDAAITLIPNPGVLINAFTSSLNISGIDSALTFNPGSFPILINTNVGAVSSSGTNSSLIIQVGSGGANVSDDSIGVRVITKDVLKNATLSATSTASGFSVNDIKSDNKTDIWRSSNLTEQVITATWSEPESIGGVGIIFSNLVKDSTVRFQFYLDSSSPNPDFTTPLHTFVDDKLIPIGFDSIGYLSFSYGGGRHFSTFFDTLAVEKLELIITSVGNSDGYIEIARVVAGDPVRFTSMVAYGSKFSFQDKSSSTRSASGSNRVVKKTKSRIVDVTMENLTPDDNTLMNNLPRGIGTRNPILFSGLSDSSVDHERESFNVYGHIDTGIGITAVGHNRSSTPIRMLEI